MQQRLYKGLGFFTSKSVSALILWKYLDMDVILWLQDQSRPHCQHYRIYKQLRSITTRQHKQHPYVERTKLKLM